MGPCHLLHHTHTTMPSLQLQQNPAILVDGVVQLPHSPSSLELKVLGLPQAGLPTARSQWALEARSTGLLLAQNNPLKLTSTSAILEVEAKDVALVVPESHGRLGMATMLKPRM